MLCAFVVGVVAQAPPTHGINPGPQSAYAPPAEALENTEEVQGEVSLLQEKSDLGDGLSDDDDEEEDDEGPGGIDDAPDWAMGKGEQPGGEENMKGGWKMRVFTPEQETRLGVNKYGEHKPGEKAMGLGESSKATKDDDDNIKIPADDDDSTDDTSIEDAADVAMPDNDPWPW